MTGAPKVPAGNWLDRVVGYVDPVRQVRRERARVQLGAWAGLGGSGAYTGASRSKSGLAQWFTRNLSPDAATLADLGTLRERSRDLVRNEPLAGGAIATLATNVVGAGLRPRPMIDREVLGLDDAEADAWERAAEREWWLATGTAEIDAARTLNFGGLQELALRSVLEGGDVFALRLYAPRPGSPYGLKIQLIEAERVCNPAGTVDTVEIAGGVEVDRYGAPVAYHIARGYPGERGRGLVPFALETDRVAAFGEQSGLRNVLHVYRPARPGQRRGVPYLAPVVEAIKQLGRYAEAEILAAVINSCFAVALRSETGDAGAGLAGEPAAGDDIIVTEPGQIFSLAPGESVESFTPGRPSQNFDPFFQSIVRHIGVGLEIPFEILLKHFTASYSASRAALETFWQMIKSRRSWFADSFCVPVYEAVIIEAIAAGRLQAPGFWRDPLVRQSWLQCEWVGPAQPQLDEVKAVKAAGERVALGISTLAEESAARGSDWELNHKQRVKEMAARTADGLELVAAPAAGGAPPPPAADETDEDEE